MAHIVLGLGSSHTPQLSTTADWWEDHALRDSRNPYLLGRDGEIHNYAELAAVAEWAVSDDRLKPDVWESLHQRAQDGIGVLRDTLAEVDPDVVVVVGDDQEEMFRDDGMPTFAVYYGEAIYDMPTDEAKKAAMPGGLRAALWAAHGDTAEKYPVPAKLGRHVIDELILDEFDIVALTRQPQERSVGHAFTFVRRRLMGERIVPLLPIALNAYNPPNQPSPRRCYQFGRSLRRAIESFPEDLRVAIVASGGLSHFVIDEELDQRVLKALQNRDADALMTIPRRFMRSGTSETLNWITAGAALDGLSMNLVDYVPAYRSAAGTGVGMAFATWR